jgi:adenine/guanine phosphoribosyltransferase-like PRPP-binding protein
MLRPVEIDIREYTGEKTAGFNLAGVPRIGRVDWLHAEDPEVWIVSNDVENFSDVKFIRKAAEVMADLYRPYDIDCLFMPEARSLMTGVFVASNLGVEWTAVARKRISPDPGDVMQVDAESITSGLKKYSIDGLTIDILTRAKRVGIYDDVISRSNTTKSLLRLAEMAGANVKVIGALGVEGATFYRELEDWFKNDRLIFSDVLPIWATGETYKAMKQEEAEVMAMYADLPAGRSVLKP